jgi:hypothetical protein
MTARKAADPGGYFDDSHDGTDQVGMMGSGAAALLVRKVGGRTLLRRVTAGVVVAAAALALWLVSSIWSRSDEDRYHFKPASQWTICGHVPGLSEREWSHDSTGDKWLQYEWAHNCTFRFIGWNAATTMRAHEHPEMLED